MRILFVTSELKPLVKTGGLADVADALPRALAGIGVEVRYLLPGYTDVLKGCIELQRIADFPPFAQLPACQLLAGTLPHSSLPAYVVACPELYERSGGPYADAYGVDWPDNHLRFAQLGRVGAVLAHSTSPAQWRPEVLHCNDWQSGMACAYLNFAAAPKAPALMTIHNLAYQGIFPPGAVAEVGLPPASFAMHGVEYYGNFSFLKAGIYYAQRISTVSPNYALEIQREPLGFGMQGLLAARATTLSGILNGIDTAEWDPAADRHLAVNYSGASLELKVRNKAALCARLGIDYDARIPLLGCISRFTFQKGLDVVLEALPEILSLPARLAVLGSGEAAQEQAFQRAAQNYPGQVAVTVGFDEALSHLIEAGADAFLMPSRYEPCGLNQMYSQRYGTLPVAHATGGLLDSVTDATHENLAARSATGFVFAPLDAPSLVACLHRLMALWRTPSLWRDMQLSAMARDFSWRHSAQEYSTLYRSMLAHA